MRLVALCATVLFLSTFSPSVQAQTITDAELLQMFESQRDAFKAARASSNGMTRGLTLVTLDNVEVTTDSSNLAAPAAGDISAGVEANTIDGAVSLGAAPLAPLEPQLDQIATAEGTAQVQPVVFGDLAPELQINIHIKFEFDSAALTDAQKPLLNQLCTVMRSSDISLFRIVGHTDASGSDEYNEKLSQLRAGEVRRYLINDCGIAAERLEAVGLGERFLADKADPNASENRRVEFQALS